MYSKICPNCDYKLKGFKSGDRTYCSCTGGFWEFGLDGFHWVDDLEKLRQENQALKKRVSDLEDQKVYLENMKELPTGEFLKEN